MVDINKLLVPVLPEIPCGEDLEYDSAFLDLVSSASYIPARKMGDDEIPAVEPVWAEVHVKAETLLGRSKDIRIAVLLSKALLNKTGFEGLSKGLEVLRTLLENFWDSIHPLPDPDDNDMTMRLNALSELGEYDSGIKKITELPLVSVRGFGDFGLKSVEDAKQTPRLRSEIDAAVLKADLKDLRVTEEHISACITHINAIRKILSEKAENIDKIDTLSTTLGKAGSFLAAQLLKRGENVSPSVTPADAQEGHEGTGQSEGSTSASSVNSSISSPEDVKRAIDLICEYYNRNEPSSPVPILLLRAKGLVSKNFMEILEDISPDGMKQVKILKGPDKKG